MEPELGSVFAIWVDRLGRYALRQMCGEDEGRSWWLDLDWFEPELPTDLDALQPLKAYSGDFDGDLSFSSTDSAVPPSWVLVGVREPLRSDPLPWVPRIMPPTRRLNEPSAVSEYEWFQRPQAQRDAYKQARNSDATVQIAGEEVPINTTWWVSPEAMRAPISELAQLVCLNTVLIDHERPDWDELLASFPFLTSVSISAPIRELTLPPTVIQVSTLAGTSADVVLHGDSATMLHTEDSLFVDLPWATELVIHQVEEVDVATVVERYPRLNSLVLFGGESGMVSGMDALERLPDLEELVLWDLDGFDTLPPLPSLVRLDIDGLVGLDVMVRKRQD